MAYIKTLTEDKVTASFYIGSTSDGKKIQRQKTFKRPSNVSKTRWLKSYHLTVINDHENELKTGDISAKDMKLDKFIEMWIKSHAVHHLRPNTLASYQDIIDRYILPHLGHLYLSKIHTVTIQMMINTLSEPRKDGTRLSRRSVTYPKQVLSSILTQAVKWGYISGNPCTNVEIPMIPKEQKKRYFDLNEVQQLISLVKDEALKYQAIFFLALSGGLRRSEILNLKVSDVGRNGVTVKKGKNDSSVRFVTLDEATMAIVRRQLAEAELLAMDPDLEGWLFTKDDGTQMFKSTPTQWLRRLCKRNKIEWAGFHALRHTSATLLISSGVDIKTVSSRIGHNQTSTTINIYAHMLRDKEEAAADLLGSILHPSEKVGLYSDFDEKTSENTKGFKKRKSL